jgi:phosphinothricin acetyltransferase
MVKDKRTQDTHQTITILRATESDSKDIWEWRNDELTKQMSISADCVSWEIHRSWFERNLVDPNRYLYLGVLNDDQKIGMCRFDVHANKNIAEVSININPKFRSRGLSSQLLSHAMVKFFEDKRMGLIATIKKSNIGSIKCFTKSGFTFEYEDRNFNYYKYILR